MSTLTGEATAIASLTEELVQRLPEVPPTLVHQAVAEAVEEFADARVREFVPLLVARSATERMRLLAAAGDVSVEHPRTA